MEAERNQRDFNDRDESTGSSALRTLLGIILVTFVFYYAREILLPIAVATILAVLLSPIVRRIEPWLGNLLSSAVVVIAAVIALGGVFYFVTTELTGVAANVASYSSNIAKKISTFEHSTPQWLEQVERGVGNVKQQLNKDQSGKPPSQQPKKVQTVADSSTRGLLTSAQPFITGAVLAGLTIVLLFFLLYGRQDLRDRIVRLSARAGIQVASQALDTAGETVSHYLFLFALINLGYGISTALILWILGMPHPELWGMLGFLLRFIPYVGAVSSALIPTAVAFAVFPGWGMAIEVLATFVVLDQISAEFIEPFLIGRGIGISPIALLISATYWSWVWGPVGLLIATPLTACFKVAGDYIPELDFLSLLLGAHDQAEDYHDFYIKLIEQDRTKAEALAIRYCDQHGIERTFHNLFKPSLEQAGQEFQDARAVQQFIFETIRELITELGDRFSKPRSYAPLRIIGVSAPEDPHTAGLLMALELMRQEGCAASFAGDDQKPEELRELVKRFDPDLLCLSCSDVEQIENAVQLIRALKQEQRQLTIIAGGPAAVAHAQEFIAAGCGHVCRDDNDGRRFARRMQAQRVRGRAVPTRGNFASADPNRLRTADFSRNQQR